MIKYKFITAVTAALIVTLMAAAPAEAQKGWLKDVVKDAAKSETKRQIRRGVRGAIRCAVGEYECERKAKEDGKEVVYVDDNDEIITDDQGDPVMDRNQLPAQYRTEQAATASPTPAPPMSANYDFEPGDRVLFQTDFAGNAPGDFPRELEYVRGNMQLVDWQGQMWLRGDGGGQFEIPLSEQLPEQFTLEFTILDEYNSPGNEFVFAPRPEGSTRDCTNSDNAYLQFGYWGGSGIDLRGGGLSRQELDLSQQPHRVEMVVDGEHAQVFVDRRLFVNVPRADFGQRTSKVWVCLDGDPDAHTFLADIRIAGGGKDLYDALATAGRVAVHDILFDTDQATIKPQSANVLTQIGTMLSDHPEMSLMIEGHTDSTGDFDHNMDLSQRRAESVKQWLVSNHGIADTRLRSMGLGSTQPKESNDTEDGRRRNRRVELVKVGG